MPRASDAAILTKRKPKVYRPSYRIPLRDADARLNGTVKQKLDGCLEHYERVEQCRRVFYIKKVVLQHLRHIPWFQIPFELDLSPTGQTGTQRVALVVVRDRSREATSVLDHLGPRSHQRHVAADYVEKLGQLVDAASAKEGAYVRDAAVASNRPSGTRRDPHRTKLKKGKTEPVLTDSLLAKEDRPVRFGDDRHSREKHRRRKDQQADARERRIDCMLPSKSALPFARVYAPGDGPDRSARRFRPAYRAAWIATW